MYKAKYFPGSTFFESKLSPNLSYAWKGIWEARSWLTKGYQWWIGDGKKARIWMDKWIPTVWPNPCPPEGLGPNSLRATVSTLIDPCSLNRNTQAVYSLFSPRVAAAILKIILSPTPYADTWIWMEARNGNFSVKSAYRLILSSQSEHLGEMSTVNDFKSFWKAVWHMKVPHKV